MLFLCDYEFFTNIKISSNAGNSIMICTRFMLAIDGKVGNQNIRNFTNALSMLLASFYAFNIEYPEEGKLTMEFVQRLVQLSDCEVGFGNLKSLELVE